METVTRNVSDLDQSERSVFERVVGHQLRETQRIILNVVNVDLRDPEGAPVEPFPDVPDHWKIYEGMTEQEIDDLDLSITRCNLTRTLE